MYLGFRVRDVEFGDIEGLGIGEWSIKWKRTWNNDMRAGMLWGYTCL